jgi:transcriptional regulator with XRE-family HTH domain
MDNKQVFAQNLKDLREKTGISQRTLAKKLGIHATDVSSYERGVNLPTVEKLIKIADFFDV